MIDLNKINSHGLTSIYFDEIDNRVEFNKLDYMNMIFARNGLYIALNSNFGTTIDKIPNVRYKNLSLVEYESDWELLLKISKPPKEILEEILECFKYVNNKINYELLCIVYYDTIKNKFIIDIIKYQIINTGSINYLYTEKYEMNPRYIKYLEIHSHNSMIATFSSIDNTDESYKTLCFYGVLGKINEFSTIYNVDQKFRIWSGIKFRYVSIYDIFSGIELPINNITNSNKKILDDIIATSNEINDQKLKDEKESKELIINPYNNQTKEDQLFQLFNNEEDSDYDYS